MKSINIPKEILMRTDFLNTTGGGMSQSVIKLNRTEEGYLLELSMPGVGIENLKIDIINQRLLVYFGIEVAGSEALSEAKEEESITQLPYFITNLPVPPDADVENISARYEAGKLVILAPFNNQSQGYSRRVEIEY